MRRGPLMKVDGSHSTGPASSRSSRRDSTSSNIARIQLRSLERRLAKLDIKLDVDDAALAHVAQAGFDPVYGARPLKRAIQQQIENPLAKDILAGEFAQGDTIHVREKGGNIAFGK